MAFFKIDVELEWLGFALINIFLTYIFYRKANKPPEFTCEHQCVRDECVKLLTTCSVSVYDFIMLFKSLVTPILLLFIYCQVVTVK